MYYFIQLDDLPHGPLTADQVRQGVMEKRYKSTDLARRETEETWRQLASISEIALTESGTLKPRPNPMAKASLVLDWAAIVFFVLLVLGLAFDPLRILIPISIVPTLLCPLLASVFAKLALRKIRNSLTEMEGHHCADRALSMGFALVIFIPLGLSLLVPTFAKVSEPGNQTIAIRNCRKIIAGLKLYSADCGGNYPDHDLPNARTSNEVFRLLFKSGVADSEVIFGCPASDDGKPDGNIGKAPDYAEALKPGENHWAMTKGLNDSCGGSFPIVFESPVDATWPPKWNPDAAGTTKRGRTWIGGKVIIGFNDGTVEALPLESTKGERVGLRPRADGTPIFPAPPPGQKYEIMDVAR